jgi:hypothetical protein
MSDLGTVRPDDVALYAEFLDWATGKTNGELLALRMGLPIETCMAFLNIIIEHINIVTPDDNAEQRQTNYLCQALLIGAYFGVRNAPVTSTVPPKGKGYLEVAATDSGEVVVNHPDLKRDERGIAHIVFSVEEARMLAITLNKTADEAEQIGTAKIEAQFTDSCPVVGCRIAGPHVHGETEQS